MPGHRDDDQFDPTLIDEMLALTPVERIVRHDHARALVITLERAGRQRDARRSRPDPTPRPRRS